MPNKEQCHIWIVNVTWEHYGAGEEWVYLIAARSATEATDKAKKDCGYDYIQSKPNPLGQPTGTWSFTATLFEPDADTMIDLSNWEW